MTDKEFWRQAAACRQADPELFFPISSSGRAVQQVALAKAFCDRCQVVRFCLDFALRTRQAHGVWGGTTEQERVRLWRHEALSARRLAHDSRHPREQRPAPGDLAG